MSDRERRETEKILRTCKFLGENATDYVHNRVAISKTAALGEVIIAIEQHREKESFLIEKPDESEKYDADLLDDLLDQMRDMADFARLMSEEISEMENKMRMPRCRRPRHCLAAAQQFAEDAAEYEQKFIEYGMERNFVGKLRTKIAELENLIASENVQCGCHSESFSGQIKQGINLIFALDPIIRQVYRQNPVKLAGWIQATRTERRLAANAAKTVSVTV